MTTDERQKLEAWQARIERAIGELIDLNKGRWTPAAGDRRVIAKIAVEQQQLGDQRREHEAQVRADAQARAEAEVQAQLAHEGVAH